MHSLAVASSGGRRLALLLVALAAGAGCRSSAKPAAGMGEAGAQTDAVVAARNGLPARAAVQTCRPPANWQAPAARLSETGCFDAADPRKPAPGLVPYEVTSPLWSDGAHKERFIALPDGTRLRVAGDHLDTPVGTVLVKTFSLGGKRVETRLLVRFDETTWAGYSYEWNADESDAHVLPDAPVGVRKRVAYPGGEQTWSFPSRAECFRCHTDAARVAIGLELPMLDRQVVYTNGVRAPQLEEFERIGLLDGLPRVRKPALPAPDAPGATLEQRVRAYMHVNCAICHRPGGNFDVIDLRFDTPLTQMRICDVPPEKGILGVEGALRLSPGRPERSVMSLRMHTLDRSVRMPEIGTELVDAAGTALMDEWIRSLKTCDQ